MKRNITLSLVVAMIMVLAMLMPMVSAFAGGDGSVASPYQIASWIDLNTTKLNLTVNYELIANLTGQDADYVGIADYWIPIGSGSAGAKYAFKGNFSGNNNSISDLRMNTSLNYVGLFGVINQSFIYDVKLLNISVNIPGSTYAGTFIGFIDGESTIRNIYVNGSTITSSSMGGIIGYTKIGANISISYCSSDLTMIGGAGQGGIVSSLNAGANLSFSYSNVYINGTSSSGGLVGVNNLGRITNSYSTGEIYGTSTLGGLAGSSDGIINSSWSTANVSGMGTNCLLGGLVGVDTGVIDNSSWFGSNLTSPKYTTGIGGLVGYLQNGIILNSRVFINGIIDGNSSSSRAGGLVGQVNTAGTIMNSYVLINTTGQVKGGGEVGGLFGRTQGVISINNSIYIYGIINGTNTGGIVGYLNGTFYNNSIFISHTSRISGNTATFDSGVNLLPGVGINNSILVFNPLANISFLKSTYSMSGDPLRNITISNNFVSLNEKQIGLNVSANITMFNMPASFTNPIIYRNNFICQQVGGFQCFNFTSLNSGTVVFNISGAGNYSIGEYKSLSLSILSPLNTTYTNPITDLNWSFSDSYDKSSCKFTSNSSYYNVSFDCLSNITYDMIIPTRINYTINVPSETTPEDVVMDSEFFWIIGTQQDKVYKYNLNGTFTGVNFTIIDFLAGAITKNSSNIFVAGTNTDRVYVFTLNGSYLWNFSNVQEDGTMSGIALDDNYIYLLGSTSGGKANVFYYYLNGSYTNISFPIKWQDSSPRGLALANNKFYVLGANPVARIYVYNLSGTYIEMNMTPTTLTTAARGITVNNSNLWVMETTLDQLVEYSFLNSSLGSNTWTVWMNDSINNITSKSITFNYDPEYSPPIINPIKITYPIQAIYNSIVTSMNFSLNLTVLPTTLPYAYTSQGIIQIMPTKNNTAIYGCEGTLVNANSATDGNTNTAAIVAGCYDPMSAARYCDGLTFNGYSDWYLPANNTLLEIMQQDVIDNITKGDYSATWQSMYTEEATISSTELNAIDYHQINGNPPSDYSLYAKNDTGISTRCVRDNTLSSACTIWNGTANNTVSCVNNITTNLASTEGVNFWRLYYTNSFNYQWQANVSFYVDSITPQITMVAPANGSVTNRSNIVLNYTYIEANASKIWWTNNSGVTNTSLSPFGTNISAIGAWNQGWNNVTVYVNDTVGFENYTGVDFFVDSIYPLITMVAPANGSIFQTNTPIKINFTVVDTNLGVCYYNNGSTNQYLASCLDNITYTPTQGWNQIKIYINDTVNNVNQTNVTFFVDSIIPLISITSPLNGSLINTSTTTITYTATDTYLTNCFWSNGTTNHSTTCGANIIYPNNYGYNTIWVYANDSASNLNTSKVTYLADPTDPAATMMTPTDNSYVNKTALNFSVNATDIVGLKNITIYLFNSSGLYNQTNITIPGNPVSSMIGVVITMVDNVYTWFYQLYDMVGNGYTSATQTVTVDSLNPLITIVQPLNGTLFNTTTVQVNWTLSDSHLANCFWSNGTTNRSIACGSNVSYTANQGYNTIWAYANDSVSNLNTSKVTFFVDSIIPLISIVNPTNGSAIGVDISTLINYTVVDANLNNCWWNNGSVNHALPDCYTNITYTLILGYQTITIYVNDTLGQVNSSSTILIGDRLNFDFVTPLTDVNNTNKNISKITIQLSYSSPSGFNYSTIDLYNVTRNSVGRVMYNISTNTNGICYQETANNYTSCGGIGIGTYDNETAGVININYTKPGTALNSSLWTVKHGNTTQAIATNVSIPLDCWNTYADKLQLRMVSLAGPSVEYSYAQCYNGTTWITLSNATSNSSAVHSSSGATTIYAATDGDFATKVGYKSGTGWLSTITHSGLQSSAMIFEEAMVWNMTITPNMTASFTNIPDGRYYFNATIINTLGLANATGTRQILIDTTMPVFNITQPLNNSIFNITTVQINYTATDTNLDKCWYNNGSVNQYITCGTNISYTGFQGYNNITISVNDTTGNTMYQTITFLVDSLNPLINFTYPTYDQSKITGYGSNNLTIHVEVNDTNFANTTVYIYNSSSVMVDNHTFYTSTFTYRYNPTSLDTYYYTANTTDLAGNRNNTAVRAIVFTDFNFTICNGTMAESGSKVVKLLNLTFYDEDDPSIIISASLTNFQSTYYMFDPLTTKFYAYGNITGNNNYAFCGYPMNTASPYNNPGSYYPMNMSVSFTYSHVNYTTRTYTDPTASYVLTNGTLALGMVLKSNSQLTTFTTQTAAGTVIPGVDVNVYVQVLGVSTLLISGVTDSSGAISMQLNPLKTYTIIYSKSGYQTYTQTVQPVSTSYTVVLTADASAATGGGVGGSSYIPYTGIDIKTYVLPAKTWFKYNQSMVFYMNTTITGTAASNFGGNRMEIWTSTVPNLTNGSWAGGSFGGGSFGGAGSIMGSGGAITNSSNTMYLLNVSMLNRTGNITSLAMPFNCSSYKDLIVATYVYNTSNYSNYALYNIKIYQCGSVDITIPGNDSIASGLNDLGLNANTDTESAFGYAWWIFLIVAISISALSLWLGFDTTNFGLIEPKYFDGALFIFMGILSYANVFYISGLGSNWVGQYGLFLVVCLLLIGDIIKMRREGR